MRNIVSFLFVLFLLCAGCSSETARVGSIAISREDLSQRAKVSEIYYPGSGKAYVALSQLIKGNLSLEILRSLGKPVDDVALQSEAKRIDENTKAPETLAKIKAVYGTDHAAYLRTFVSPVYAERMLYGEVFLKSLEIQSAAKVRVEAMIRNAAASPASFLSIAKQESFQTAQLRISNKKGIIPFKNKPFLNHAEPVAVEQAARLLPLLAGLAPGKVLPQAIEWPESFQALRLIQRAGSDVVVESAVLPKQSFDDWFWEKAANIPVRIKDLDLKKELVKEVSWAKNLKME